MNPEKTREITRVCPKCGQVLEENWRNCPICGWKSETNQPAPPQPHPQNRLYGRMSVLCGVIALLIFGIPLGLVAMFTGGWAKINYNDNVGLVGLGLGFIDIVLALFALSLMFG